MKKSLLKYTAAVLSGAVLLGGCGADGKKQPESGTVQETESEQGSLQTAADITGQTPESTEENQTPESMAAEAATDSIPAITITQDKKEWYTDDGEVLLLEAKASRVEVTSDGFDALKDTLAKQWNGIQRSYDEELGWAKEDYEFSKEQEYAFFTNYFYEQNVELCRNDSNVISFCESFNEYTGGAHGMYGVEGKTFDVKSGRELQLGDILMDSEGFYSKATDYILQKLDEEYGEELFPEYEETVRTDTFGENPVSWYLDDTGIVIDYALYEITPYAAGAPEVILPYDEFAAYIKEEYTGQK